MAAARIVSPDGEWVETAAAAIAASVRQSVEARGRCHLALAGGGTPVPVYRALASMDLPWGAVEIWFGDERCVPAEHPDSNYRSAKEALLDHIVAGAVHRMRGEDPDREAAALDYAASLPEVLDVVLLGMGGDGHTASIFPGQDPSGRVAVVQGPKPPPWRLTLTAETLRAARELLVLVRGADKAETVAAVWSQPIGSYPIQLALGGTWIVDASAASQLPEA